MESNTQEKKQKLILDGHKLAWHPDRVQAWLDGKRIAPITIDCALTRKCNYKCEYCYGQLQANDEKKMTKDVIFRFLDDAAEIGVKGLSFISDGESTCSPHLYDAIKHGKANGIDMALGTNGSLLKKNRLEEILPCLTYLRFNFSAGEPKRYAEIHGTKEENFYKTIDVIKECVRIKKENRLEVTPNLQMVLQPHYVDQIIPFAKLGRELGVVYSIIKHCSDDEEGSLGVDYERYLKPEVINEIKKAQELSTEDYEVRAKWSKILSGGKREYSRCFGPPFMLQLSGSGLIAPCGPFFNSKYKKYHIGNIVENSFKEVVQGDRYWEVMDYLGSGEFDPRTECGTLCFQHKVNEYLYDLKSRQEKGEKIKLKIPHGELPNHINFI